MYYEDYIEQICELTRQKREIVESVFCASMKILLDKSDNSYPELYSPDMGIIKTNIIPERVGRNPQTGEVKTFPESRTLLFKINGKFYQDVIKKE